MLYSLSRITFSHGSPARIIRNFSKYLSYDYKPTGKKSKALRLLATAIFFLIIYNMLTTLFPPYYRLDITLSSDQSDRVRVYHWNGLLTPKLPCKSLYT